MRKLVIGLICVLAISTLRAAESLSVLLQKGIFAEETEGNLDAAIQIYEGIVRERDANRSIVAQAQYRLGVCQMKRGKKEEAAAAFRTLIEQFPKEAELVAKTRARLFELGQPASPAFVRQVWAQAEDFSGGVSPDGRYLSFVDGEMGDLAIRDLTTGQNRRLTDKGSWEKSKEFAAASTFSADGRLLAYLWCHAQNRYDLRIISPNNSSVRVLVSGLRPFLPSVYWTGLWPMDWSPDGTAIALVTENDRHEYHMVSVSTIDGSKRPLKSLGRREPGKLCFSPDGRYLAYGCSGETNRESDIFVLDLSSGAETALVQHPADDTVVGWAPDGKGLLLTSDRRGSTDLWLLPFSAAKAAGELRLLKPNFSYHASLGITRSGALYYGIHERSSGLYEASIDVSTSKVLSPPKELPSRFRTWIIARTLSPDGRFLAFSHSRGYKERFHVEDLKTGQLREISFSAEVRAYQWPVWSADSRQFVVHGWTDDTRNGLHLVDATTGETTEIVVAEPGSETRFHWMGFVGEIGRYLRWDRVPKKLALVRQNLRHSTKHELEIPNMPDQSGIMFWRSFVPSPDDRHLFYIRRSQEGASVTNWMAVRRDLGTGREMEFLRATNLLEIVSESTTGHPILVTLQPPKGTRTVKVIDVAENSATERFSFQLPERARPRWNWFGSKPHLLFTKEMLVGTGPQSELWTISGENGEMRKTELVMPGMAIIGTHGENQIFLEKTDPPLSEIWVMENFLPQVAAKK